VGEGFNEKRVRKEDPKMRLGERGYLVSLLWAALLVLPTNAASAGEAELDGKASTLDRAVTTREERSAIFNKFGVPATALYAALPPGEALVLSGLCGTDPACQSQALIDREAHMGWGKVAEDLKKNGLTTNDKVGEAVRRVTEAHRDLVAKDEKAPAEKRETKTEKVERMAKPEPLERIERPERPERPWR